MFSLRKLGGRICLVAGIFSAVPALASIDSTTSENCLEQAASDLAQGIDSAKRLLGRDFSRCIHLPSIEVKQACSNAALEAYESKMQSLRAEYSANIQACLH